MTETPERLVERLSTESQKTLEFFDALTEEQWERRLYTEGSRWTVHQLMAHFVTTEIAVKALIGNILGGGSGAPGDFDVDAYNERAVDQLRNLTSSELMQQFYDQRGLTIDLVRGVTTEELLQTGRHPFLGETTLEEVIKMLYRHNQIHQRDVRRILSSGEG